MFTRLSSFSADALSMLFSMLAPSPIICKFKIVLCQKYLTTISANHNAGTTDLRPKPQARAQPRSIPVARRHTEQEKGNHTSTSGLTLPASIASKHSPPTSAEILRLLELNLHNSRASSAVTAFMQIKFELLVSFGNLQTCAAITDDKDLEWPRMLRDGRLAKAVDAAFKGGDEAFDQTCRETLREIINVW